MKSRWIAVLSLVGLFAIPHAAGAAPGGCGKLEGSITDKHATALCRDLGRRAVAERPGRDWSAAWSDTCSFTSRTRSDCTFKLVWRDHSLPKAERRPARVCKGAAVVTGRSRFRVHYPEGCVYPDEGR